MVLLSDLRGLTFSGCWWSMVIMVCLIRNIACMLRNIPRFSASYAEATTFFSVWQTVRTGPFSFGLGVSVVGG